MLAIDLERAAENIPDCSAETSQRLHQLWVRTSEIGADLHHLSHQLHSSTLESLGLVLGLSSFCTEFAAQQGIQVDFAHRDAPCVPSDVALCLFRIVQEGLRNVKRHSEATRAEVRLEAVDDSLHLSVSDRGKGFQSKKSWEKGGLGIRSMEERLRLVGGSLEVQSRLGKGTRIHAWVPLKSAVKQAGLKSRVRNRRHRWEWKLCCQVPSLMRSYLGRHQKAPIWLVIAMVNISVPFNGKDSKEASDSRLYGHVFANRRGDTGEFIGLSLHESVRMTPERRIAHDRNAG